jgi:hypothetical protein
MLISCEPYLRLVRWWIIRLDCQLRLGRTEHVHRLEGRIGLLAVVYLSVSHAQRV